MSRRAPLLQQITLVCMLSATAVGQCVLSANSGINSADTCVTVDLTVTGSTTMNLPQAFYNPATQTTSNVLTIAPPTQTFHVESGYDTSGGLVMNIWPTGTPADPTSNDTEAIGFIRFAGGQITVFKQNGAPLPLVLPAGVPTTWPLTLLGSNPGPSAISNLVVPSVQNYANALHANYTTSTNPTADYVTVSEPNGSTATWTYVPSGSNWIAQKIVLSPAISSGSASRTINFANMSWYDNATNDSARTAKGYTAKAPPAPTTTNPSGISGTSSSSGPTSVSNLGGPQNVVFQHGIFSSSSTWTRMTNWLNQDFRFGNEIVPSLSSTSSLSSQGTALVNEINSVGGSNYILIGHSQGGLISRYAAQQYQIINSATAKGVVTLDTPNQGADIAITGGPVILAGLEFLGTYLWDVTGCSSPDDNFVCYLAAVVFFGAPLAADDWYSTLATIQDLTPGSTFLNQLNSYGENFPRAGIVAYTPMRWNETRILDDKLFLAAGCYPETGCGERAIAGVTDIVYDEVVGLFVFCIFEEIFDPNNADFWAQEALYFFEILIGMDAVDGFWNIIVSGLSPSDALVQASSENYPYTSAVQYPIYGADSHTGATTSTYARSTLDQVLAGTQFQVPTQASCAFTLSPSSLSISSAGGTSSFNLTTGSGCQWSAISQTPWINITSGSSGTSSGSVSFSIPANPVDIPRTGTIQVGNNSSTVIFTVTEVAVCTYSLSASLIVFQPGGGSGTVTVTTQTGCVWSVVPNAAWLTISSGASGTGSGSFTFSAAPANTNLSYTGTIRVLSQLLTVVVGSSVGTSGTGTVTVSGGARFGYSCPVGCRLKSCCNVIWESGTVSATVAGVTFSTTYAGSTPTAASVASALASKINVSTSPVSATVSSNVITITSKIKGAVTNYSLSTSYSYDTTYFSSPAFTAAASGSTLTGGAD